MRTKYFSNLSLYHVELIFEKLGDRELNYINLDPD